jgi:hypothetical protein
MAGTAPVRRKKRHYRNEAVRPPFDLECELKDDGSPYEDGETPDCIRFHDFQKLPLEDGFSFLEISQSNPRRALEMLVGDDQWDRFWAEWRRDMDFEAGQELMRDVIEHFSGASRGNS